MKHLLPFHIYESQTTSGLTKKQEYFLNRYTEGTWSVNPTTGLVDIRGGFKFIDMREISFYEVKFGNVTRNFNCRENNLESLEGAPLEVNRNFDCSYNELQSLAGAPQKVDGNFNCFSNRLLSLEGAPQKVGGGFDCTVNFLQSLVGAPKQINGPFYCDGFNLKKGKWNMEGWMEVLGTGTEKAKELMLTLPYVQPDWWNSELQRDPGKTIHLLAPLWKDMSEDLKSKIKIPSGYENEFDLFSGFDDLGLF